MINTLDAIGSCVGILGGVATFLGIYSRKHRNREGYFALATTLWVITAFIWRFAR